MSARLLLAALLCLAACSDAPIQSRIVGDAMPHPVGNVAGDPAQGKTVFTDRDGGHCVLCHRVDGLEALFQGNLGPDLSHVGARLEAGQIRLRIVDYSQVKESATMPPYFRINDLNQVQTSYVGKTVLSPEEVEHLVAYLASLK